MAQASSCCCGCSLRTGTLILLWVILLFNVIALLDSFLDITKALALDNVLLFLLSLIAIVITITGIVGVKKNQSNFITVFYYFLCFQAIYCALLILVLIVFPSAYLHMLQGLQLYKGKSSGHLKIEIIMGLILGQTLSCALFAYFACIVKSYRDSLQDQSNNEVAAPPHTFTA